MICNIKLNTPDDVQVLNFGRNVKITGLAINGYISSKASPTANGYLENIIRFPVSTTANQSLAFPPDLYFNMLSDKSSGAAKNENVFIQCDEIVQQLTVSNEVVSSSVESWEVNICIFYEEYTTPA